MKRALRYLLAGMLTPLVLGIAAAVNPLPGTLWFLVAGFLPIGGLALFEEIGFQRRRRESSKQPSRVERFQHAMRIDSRIRAGR